MPERLRPTLRHTRARQYLRPGGPWDIGSLAVVLDTGPLEPDVAAVAGVETYADGEWTGANPGRVLRGPG